MNSFGTNFRISIFGESHGDSVGVTIDGLQAGIKLSADDFISDLVKRKSGAYGTTSRIETDIPLIISGLYNGFSTGAPLTILFKNENIKPSDYLSFTDLPRPGHADFTASEKFGGFNDPRGSGHFSGRITLALVAAGVIAKKIISPIEITATIESINGSMDFKKELEKAFALNDSVGAIVSCTARNLGVGLGEPFFNSVESVISHLVFSIPAIKGIEFGSGFNCSHMLGSEHNDRFINSDGTTDTNNAGGILGGITNGNDLFYRVAVKPTSSISKPQLTHNFKSNRQEELLIEGRHDTCIALRIPVVIEAVTAIAFAELLLGKVSYVQDLSM